MQYSNYTDSDKTGIEYLAASFGGKKSRFTGEVAMAVIFLEHIDAASKKTVSYRGPGEK